MPENPLFVEQRDASPSIKAVILDYGKVLVRSPTPQEFSRLAKVLNVDFDMFYKLWEASRGGYDRSDFTAQEYWLKLAAQCNSSVDAKQIDILRKLEVEIWLHADPGMLDWLSRLHAAGIKTALLSNMPTDLMTYVLSNLPWMQHFTFKTFSAEVRLIKPAPEIYRHTLDGLGVVAPEAIFVDDRENNVQAARALGMHAIEFHSVEQLRRDLEELRFPVLPAATQALSAESGVASPSDGVSAEGEFSPQL
jgi:putative hydrolase of the HAD superfamily